MKFIGYILWMILGGLVFWRANVVAPLEPGLAALQQVSAVLCIATGVLTLKGRN